MILLDFQTLQFFPQFTFQGANVFCLKQNAINLRGGYFTKLKFKGLGNKFQLTSSHGKDLIELPSKIIASDDNINKKKDMSAQDGSKYGKIIFESTILKRQSNGQWSRLQCALWEDGAIRFYNDRNYLKVVGKIKVDYVDAIEAIDDDRHIHDENTPEFRFAIESQGLQRRWQFAVNNQQQLTQWIGHIQETKKHYTKIEHKKEFSKKKKKRGSSKKCKKKKKRDVNCHNTKEKGLQGQEDGKEKAKDDGNETGKDKDSAWYNRHLRVSTNDQLNMEMEAVTRHDSNESGLPTRNNTMSLHYDNRIQAQHSRQSSQASSRYSVSGQSADYNFDKNNHKYAHQGNNSNGHITMFDMGFTEDREYSGFFFFFLKTLIYMKKERGVFF
ncbi:RNA recognition motif containing protein [Reticulomyxa filosa]|uniref:RNA recognition motif containing protein n=1 Tax=Reticulomyxa filosa TaxID=46433 RepID=X6NH30_RETFI|nr:RNA recognition motif containing protein [Reticulomyxa filosa]|eukprot:ETO25034.1 RNA recognition motif containing protein [Reticulomyxa filosa]